MSRGQVRLLAHTVDIAHTGSSLCSYRFCSVSRSAGDWEGSRRRGPLPSLAGSAPDHRTDEPEGFVSPRGEIKISPEGPGKAGLRKSTL